jgi:hypothetical protein
MRRAGDVREMYSNGGEAKVQGTDKGTICPRGLATQVARKLRGQVLAELDSENPLALLVTSP